MAFLLNPPSLLLVIKSNRDVYMYSQILKDKLIKIISNLLLTFPNSTLDTDYWEVIAIAVV